MGDASPNKATTETAPPRTIRRAGRRAEPTAGAVLARRTRREQRLPRHVEDDGALAALANLVLDQLGRWQKP